MIDVVFFLLGIITLFFTGDLLVKGSISLSGILKVPTFIVAVTIVSFGTSAPELAISLNAALNDHSGIAIGNIVGSNIANILFALPISLLVRPIKISGVNKIDCITLFLSTIIYIYCLKYLEVLDFITGSFLLLTLLIYLLWTITDAKKGNRVDDDSLNINFSLKKSIIYIFIGLFGVLLGSEVLVKGAVNLARIAGISESVIGLSLVAIGSSLPEVVTSSLAAIRGSGGFLVGAIIGSNLFNILAITGISSLVIPISTKATVSDQDLFVLIISTIILIALISIKKKIVRSISLILLIIYILYILNLYIK